MTVGNPPTSEGSWQPDPTGRYKLRWRNASGNWTDHVYSADGTAGTDPFHNSTTDTPTFICDRCGHTGFVAKRDRTLWHLCFWTGLFILVPWIALPFLQKWPYCARCGTRGYWLTPDAKAPRRRQR